MLENMTDKDLLHLKSVLTSSGLGNRTGKRTKDIAQYGYELKWAYHVVRLMNEVEQILVEGDLDLQRNREQLKSIRRGEWTLDELRAYFQNKEHALETAYANSPLPHGPDEEAIKELLMNCLEQHYGSLSAAVSRVPSMDAMLLDIQALVDKYKEK